MPRCLAWGETERSWPFCCVPLVLSTHCTCRKRLTVGRAKTPKLLLTGTTINSEIRPADPERSLDHPAMRSESAGLQSPLLPAAEQAPSAAGPSDGPAAQRRLDVDDVLRLDEFSDASHLSTLRTRFLRQAAAPGGKNAFKACRKLRRAVVRQLSRDKAERAAVVGKPQLDGAREHVRFFLPKTSSGELLSLRCSEKEFSKHVGTGVSLYMRFQKVTSLHAPGCLLLTPTLALSLTVTLTR